MLRSALSFIVLSTLALPAMAVESYSYKTRGNGADASFAAYDDCSSTYLSLWGSEESTQYGPGKPKQNNYAQASSYSYNWCTGESGYAWGSATGVFAGNGTQGASFVGTITMVSETCYETGEFVEYCDEYSGECWSYPEWACDYVESPLALDVIIAPEGEIYRGTSNNHYSSRYFRHHDRSMGTYSYGSASGSAVMNDHDFAANATDSWASLGKFSNGSRAIYFY